jgi:hypothetical protein
VEIRIDFEAGIGRQKGDVLKVALQLLLGPFRVCPWRSKGMESSSQFNGRIDLVRHTHFGIKERKNGDNPSSNSKTDDLRVQETREADLEGDSNGQSDKDTGQERLQGMRSGENLGILGEEDYHGFQR